MQLRRGPRDRTTWTLLDFPLQVYARWTALFSFGLSLFTCQLERCVFRNLQMSTAALYWIALDNTTTAPHCTICDEFLGNAIQRPVLALCLLITLSIRIPLSGLHETRHRHSCGTLDSSALSAHPGTYFGLCKLYPDATSMQNAGCGHLHHAHCIGTGNNDRLTASCPSGCPRAMFPREPVIFDRPTPHIVVAWDGDKIDYVPIPAPQGGVAQSAPLRLTSDEVVDLIRNFLSSKGFALPGLFMRIHSRDAMTE